MNDRELEVSIAEAMGGRAGEAFGLPMIRWPEDAEARYSSIPPYATSVDALAPVEKAIRETPWPHFKSEVIYQRPRCS